MLVSCSFRISKMFWIWCGRGCNLVYGWLDSLLEDGILGDGPKIGSMLVDERAGLVHENGFG